MGNSAERSKGRAGMYEDDAEPPVEVLNEFVAQFKGNGTAQDEMKQSGAATCETVNNFQSNSLVLHFVASMVDEVERACRLRRGTQLAETVRSPRATL